MLLEPVRHCSYDHGVADPATTRPAEKNAPLLMAVDDDPALLRELERVLRDRYEPDYRVRSVTSSADALQALDEHAAAGDEVALVLAADVLDGRPGTSVLAEVHRTFPHAQRVLLVEWGRLGDAANGNAIFEAISHGLTDHYVIRPSQSPDEQFHLAISGSLLAWAEAHRRAPHTIDVVGYNWSGRAYELREVLERCALPHRFHLVDSEEGRAIVNRVRAARFPILVMPDGTVLEDPSDIEIAAASGTAVAPDREHYDLVIIGGGPSGLSAAVYGASEGLNPLLIDAGGLGGQATSSSSIRNYLGFPRGLSGGELARRAYEQAWVFGARFAFMQRVTHLTRERDCIVVSLNTRRHGGRAHRRPGHGCPLPPARRGVARAVLRRRGVLRLHRVGGLVRDGRGGVRRRGCELGRAGRAAPGALRRSASPSSCGLTRSTSRCRTTWFARSRPRRTSTYAPEPRSSTAAAAAGWSTWCCATRPATS